MMFPIIFLKIELLNTTLYTTSKNDFDKIFVLAFYNSFLKIKLNCDKKL